MKIEQGEGRDRRWGLRTHSCLTMYEDAMILVKFCFDEGYARDKVVENVLFLGIVDFDLSVGEGLSE